MNTKGNESALLFDHRLWNVSAQIVIETVFMSKLVYDP